MRQSQPYVQPRRPLMRGLYTSQAVQQELFADADEVYASIKERLVSPEWIALENGPLERRMKPEGDELVRLLLQSHYTLRGQAKPVNEVVGADGRARTHVREGTHRNVETIFGAVVAERDAHSGRGLSALHPVDADLNLPEGKFSHEVERQVALAVAQNSFEESVKLLKRTTSASVAKRQAEELTQRAATDFISFYEKSEFDPSMIEYTGPLLVLTFDQKGVVMRTEDLKEATRKQAERKLRKLQSRHCRGEPYGRKRMATVAAVYTIHPHFRTATDVINGLRRIRDVTPKEKPKPEYKRLWASLEKSPQDVIRDAFDEAKKRDPRRRKRWIVLIDGDDDLEKWAKQAAKEAGVEITIGLDFIHALQYLWKAGKAFNKEETPELENWVLDRLENILHGKVSDVAAGIRRSATLRGLDEDDREPVDKCVDYFLNRTHMMRYAELLEIGAPIATGVIEGGCRYLINDRLDVTGARWSLRGAEAVLRLRALVGSGDFDEYWDYHEQQERQRNHESRYGQGMAPKVRLSTARRHLRVVS